MLHAMTTRSLVRDGILAAILLAFFVLMLPESPRVVPGSQLYPLKEAGRAVRILFRRAPASRAAEYVKNAYIRFAEVRFLGSSAVPAYDDFARAAGLVTPDVFGSLVNDSFVRRMEGPFTAFDHAVLLAGAMVVVPETHQASLQAVTTNTYLRLKDSIESSPIQVRRGFPEYVKGLRYDPELIYRALDGFIRTLEFSPGFREELEALRTSLVVSGA